MTTNIEPVAQVEEAPVEVVETLEVVETPAEVAKEVKPEVLKKPEPYVRTPVTLPKEGAGRRPRNVPRY